MSLLNELLDELIPHEKTVTLEGHQETDETPPEFTVSDDHWNYYQEKVDRLVEVVSRVEGIKEHSMISRGIVMEALTAMPGLTDTVEMSPSRFTEVPSSIGYSVFTEKADKIIGQLKEDLTNNQSQLYAELEIYGKTLLKLKAFSRVKEFLQKEDFEYETGYQEVEELALQLTRRSPDSWEYKTLRERAEWVKEFFLDFENIGPLTHLKKNGQQMSDEDLECQWKILQCWVSVLKCV